MDPVAGLLEDDVYSSGSLEESFSPGGSFGTGAVSSVKRLVRAWSHSELNLPGVNGLKVLPDGATSMESC